MHIYRVMNLGGLLLVLMMAGCKLRPDNGVMSTAAVHFAGVFITQNIHSVNNLRMQKDPNVVCDSSDLCHVSGTIEGFSSFNASVSIDHFSETLHYLGGNPNEITSWECVDIYIGKKKVK